MSTPATTTTLLDALEQARTHRWAHMRDGGACLYSQAKAAAVDVAIPVVNRKDLAHVLAYGASPLRYVTAKEVTEMDVRGAVASWYHKGLSPATITKRLNCLGVLGVNVAGTKPPKSRALQWWLKPSEKERAFGWIMQRSFHRNPGLVDYINWTCLVGTRVEEALRLTSSDFVWEGGLPVAVTVPGLKTDTSQATLVLSSEARRIAARRFSSSLDQRLFGFSYEGLLSEWINLREAMGWPETATLKALRRNAARFLHIDCGMPLDMVRQYLRHEHIETTMGYLRLTGGYNPEEQARYLK